MIVLIRKRIKQYNRLNLIERLNKHANLQTPAKPGSIKHYVGHVTGDTIELRQRRLSRAMYFPHSVKIKLEQDFFDVEVGIPSVLLVFILFFIAATVAVLTLPTSEIQWFEKILVCLGITVFCCVVAVINCFIVKFQVQEILDVCFSAGKSI